MLLTTSMPYKAICVNVVDAVDAVDAMDAWTHQCVSHAGILAAGTNASNSASGIAVKIAPESLALGRPMGYRAGYCQAARTASRVFALRRAMARW
jgi:hypothetical protein